MDREWSASSSTRPPMQWVQVAVAFPFASTSAFSVGWPQSTQGCSVSATDDQYPPHAGWNQNSASGAPLFGTLLADQARTTIHSGMPAAAFASGYTAPVRGHRCPTRGNR